MSPALSVAKATRVCTGTFAPMRLHDSLLKDVGGQRSIFCNLTCVTDIRLGDFSLGGGIDF